MKKTMYCIAVTVAVISLFGTNLVASDKDDKIESDIKNSYVFRSYLQNDDINISSVDGVVTLTGSVSEESGKSLAGDMVTSLAGVKEVHNNLEIKGNISDAYSDAWLITKVKTTLLFHRNVNATATEVLSEGGIITLRGNADSEAQKSLTAEYAKDVKGVKSVNNEIVVLNPIMKSNKKKMGQKLETITEWIDDASITALVKTTLLYHASTNAIQTNVETKEGVVTLGGKAGNDAEKALVSKFANDVHGVKDVVNNMEVMDK
ncbi:MAG: BON domain-containing protein [Desulfamplus sp.]|nr:BON domain-containing protein [Desulfamplus sp.]